MKNGKWIDGHEVYYQEAPEAKVVFKQRYPPLPYMFHKFSARLMSEFITVAKVGDIPSGQGVAYAVNGRMVAVFNQNGRYSAIDDFCPHMGASLASGHLEGDVVTCPWHAWRFNVCDGTWCDNPRIQVDHFEVRVEGDEIQVRVPPRETPP